MSVIWFSFLLLWLHTATSTVYNVTPDYHYYPNTTCHHCHNLQHYLLNTTKYFTSNTKLLFLPGLHHLRKNLVIQNVYNISLIGNATNGATPDTVIQCNSSVGIEMTNITNLRVTNITVRSCLGNEYNNATVLIKQCTNVQLRHVVIEKSHNSYGIVGINILGNSKFSYITNNAITIAYKDTTMDMDSYISSLIIDHYYGVNVGRSVQHKIIFEFHQRSYRVKLQLRNSTFQWINTDYAVSLEINSESIGQNFLLVQCCTFANNERPLVVSSAMNLDHYKSHRDDTVWIQNCNFLNHEIINIEGIININDGPNFNISDCSFRYNKHSPALNKGINSYEAVVRVNIIISNTVFSSSTILSKGLLYVEMAELYLQGPVTFNNITGTESIIRIPMTNIICLYYIEFVNLSAAAIFQYKVHEQYSLDAKIITMENTVINFTHNKFETFLLSEKYSHFFAAPTYRYPSCFFII